MITSLGNTIDTNTRCPACSDGRPLNPSRYPEFGHCPKCNLLRRSHHLAPAQLQQIADDWHDGADHGPERLTELPEETREEADFLFSHWRKPEQARGLDVGCGFGAFIAYLNGKGVHAFGLEPSASRAHAAQARHLDIRIGRFDLTTMQREFGDQRFDVITFCDTINYMDSDALALAKKYLKPNGVLFISCHVASSPFYWGKASVLMRVGTFATVFYDKKTLRRALRSHSYRIVAEGRQSILTSHLALALNLGGRVSRLLARLPAFADLLPADRFLVLACNDLQES